MQACPLVGQLPSLCSRSQPPLWPLLARAVRPEEAIHSTMHSTVYGTVRPSVAHSSRREHPTGWHSLGGQFGGRSQALKPPRGCKAPPDGRAKAPGRQAQAGGGHGSGRGSGRSSGTSGTSGGRGGKQAGGKQASNRHGGGRQGDGADGWSVTAPLDPWGPVLTSCASSCTRSCT